MRVRPETCPGGNSLFFCSCRSLREEINGTTPMRIQKRAGLDYAACRTCDKKRLQEFRDKDYELKEIDSDLYDKCMEDPVTRDFVSSFADKKQYLDLGREIVILRDGEIVSGASSYTRYNEGTEIEVDTIESERRNHLATIACSALILRCLKEKLYPSWDAQNMNSVRLAEKLGYEFDHEYIAYEVDRARRIH
ncbi:GNAT family N-acetyltransferase [Butyrivibrio proteoclasticus]|uniref:GNAT family N-acetyltransferase n=1 Tax=Butyrivibrio proteoclasticus TaxID=43305 RepID=UPI0009DEC8BC|nr:GNAT family N-acetyltransferase [Butyrivibrio proteoclasticus]